MISDEVELLVSTEEELLYLFAVIFKISSDGTNVGVKFEASTGATVVEVMLALDLEEFELNETDEFVF